MSQDPQRLKVLFWNVQGIQEKNEESGFIKYIEKFDVVCLCETFHSNNDDRIPKTKKKFIWKHQPSTRTELVGRSRGGIITGVKKRDGIEDKTEEIVKHTQNNGICERAVQFRNQIFRIIAVYKPKQDVYFFDRLRDQVEELSHYDYNLIIGGDFNARTGNQGSWFTMDEENRQRRSQDQKTDLEGEKLIKLVEEKGWNILNGNISGDLNGKYTCHEQTDGESEGGSVIDYIIINAKMDNITEKFVVNDKKNLSNHFPVHMVINYEKQAEKFGHVFRQVVSQEAESSQLSRPLYSKLKNKFKNRAVFSEIEDKINNVYILKCLIELELTRRDKVNTIFIQLKNPISWLLKKKETRRTLQTLIMTKLDMNVHFMNAIEEFFQNYSSTTFERCPLSRIILSLYLSDLEEHLEKGKCTGITLGGRKIYSLVYANKIVLLATTDSQLDNIGEEAMKYLEKKTLLRYVEKCEKMEFSRSQKWEINYLDYVLQGNNENEKHIRRTVKKAAKTMEYLWIQNRENKNRDELLNLFDSEVVGRILFEGCEIWGWQKIEGLENVHHEYLKRVFRKNSSYKQLLLESDRRQIQWRTAEKAIQFEQNIVIDTDTDTGNEILKECWEELSSNCLQYTNWTKNRKESIERCYFP